MRSLFRRIGFFMAFILPAIVVAGFYLGGLWNFLALLFAFVILPVVDQLFGIDKTNVPGEHVNSESEALYYRLITYMWAYVQVVLIVWGAYAVSIGQLNTILEWVGFILSFSLISGGIGITVAHELGHKKPAVERFYSKVLLMTVCYMHFFIEHNRGHHVAVATPADPATARKNEHFFSFWARSVFQGYVHAWFLERERLSRNGLPLLSLRNEMVWFAILPIIFCAMLTAPFSYLQHRIVWEIPLFFFTQSIAAFSLLELVNYVEHYGIMRREILPGTYERVNPTHSWNSSHLISNFFLFQLQRHSDHHVFAYKRYQILNHEENSPQLPCGYPTMIIIAMVPPLWFSIMNKRLEVWRSNGTWRKQWSNS